MLWSSDCPCKGWRTVLAAEQGWLSCGNPAKYLVMPGVPGVWMAKAEVVAKTQAGSRNVYCLACTCLGHWSASNFDRGVQARVLGEEQASFLTSGSLLLKAGRDEGEKEDGKRARQPCAESKAPFPREHLKAKSRCVLSRKAMPNTV